jgi:hypothetical protein
VAQTTFSNRCATETVGPLRTTGLAEQCANDDTQTHTNRCATETVGPLRKTGLAEQCANDDRHTHTHTHCDSIHLAFDLPCPALPCPFFRLLGEWGRRHRAACWWALFLLLFASWSGMALQVTLPPPACFHSVFFSPCACKHQRPR